MNSPYAYERRNYYRMQMDCDVQVATEDGSVRLKGTCLNLSVKGLLIEIDQDFPEGTMLYVQIDPALDISPPLAGLMEVVRVEYKVDGMSYLVAGKLETESVAA